jgi:signal transduction histidine kinase
VQEVLREAIFPTNNNQESYLKVEYRIKDAKGQWCWINDSFKVFTRDPYGKPLSIIGSRLDVTEQKEAERDVRKLLRRSISVSQQLELRNRELAAQEEQLTAINQELMSKQAELEMVVSELSERNFELDQLVYKISHDIRSPLTSIMGLINLIRMDNRPEMVTEGLSHIERTIFRLDSFVKTMINYARTSRASLAAEEIDFVALIEQCMADFSYLENYKYIRQEINIATPSKAFRSDKLRLDIILRNLISNAIKYRHKSREDSFIRINISFPEESTCRILLEDNGIGIREEYLQKVFDMFFRATESSDGSGLGLYIVKQTIEKLGGILQLESEHNKGTRIEITLPGL